MQRLFHKEDAAAPLVEVPVGELDGLRQADGFIWLDLVSEPADRIREVGQLFDLDPSCVEEAVEVTLLSRIEEHAEFVFVVFHGFVTGAGERLRIAEIDMFIGKDYLVTMHPTPLPSVRWLQDEPEAAVATALGSPAHIAAFIAQLGSRRFVPLLDELESRIDGLEEPAFTADPRTLTEVHALKRDVAMLRRAIGPQRQVFRDLARTSHAAVDRPARATFDNVFDHHVRAGESLDAARWLLTSLLEAHRGAVADQTNEIMRVLTVFSAILLPLSLIAGLWGMNFASIPGSEVQWGFTALLGVMSIIAITLWVYFARRGFIGAPRAKELPKAVGLGLIHIGVVPIKAVATGLSTTRRGIDRLRSRDADGDDRPEKS